MKVNENQIRFPCKCGTTEHNLDLIVIDCDDPLIDFFISIGSSPKDTSLLKRIKMAWKVLFKGDVCFAEVVLDPEQAITLGSYLKDTGTKAQQKNEKKAEEILDGPKEFLEHK